MLKYSKSVSLRYIGDKIKVKYQIRGKSTENHKNNIKHTIKRYKIIDFATPTLSEQTENKTRCVKMKTSLAPFMARVVSFFFIAQIQS
jgi:hypothetical protein